MKGQEELWFQLLRRSAVEEIKNFLQENPDVLAAKESPLQENAVFVVVREREDNEGKQILSLLSQLGAEINDLNELGQNPLFPAISHDKQYMCSFLISKGVDPLVEDDFGQTTQEYALGLGKLNFLPILQKGLLGREQPLRFEQVFSEPIIKEQIPLLTYKLCKLTQSGQILELSRRQIRKLEQKKRDVIAMMQDPSLIPEKEVELGRTWRMVGLKVIDRLALSSQSFWFRRCHWWRVPKEKNKSPPIDLETIQIKLRSHVYQKPLEIRQDINKIHQVCRAKMGPNHPITRQANEMCFQFQQMASNQGLFTMK